MKTRILNSFLPALAQRTGSHPSSPSGQLRAFLVCRASAGETSFDVPVTPAGQSAPRAFRLLTLDKKMKTKLSRFSQFICAALLCVATTQSLCAGTHTWTGTGFFGQSFVFGDNFNWIEGAPTVGEAAPVVLIFPPDVDVNVTNNIPGLIVDEIQFTGANYTLHGTAAANTLTIRGSAPFLADVIVTGTNNAIASSLGLVLSNTVSFSISTNRTFAVKSAISGAGGIDKAGAGTLVMDTAGANNSYPGETTVRNGLLELKNSGGLAIPGDLIIGAAGGTAPCQVRYGDSWAVANSATVTVFTNGFFNMWGYSDTIGSLHLYGGDADTAGGTMYLNGDVTSTGYPFLDGIVSFGAVTRNLNIVNGGLAVDAELLGSSASVGLNKTGAGYLSLENTNQLQGLYTVAAGTLFVSHAGALGTTNGATVVSNGASLYLNNFISVNDESLTIQGAGDPAWGAFAFALAANWNGDVTLTGDTVVNVLSDSATSSIEGTINGLFMIAKTGIGTLRLAGSTYNYFGGAEVQLGGLMLDKDNAKDAIIGTLVIGTPNGETGDAWVSVQSFDNISSFTTVTIHPSGAFYNNGYITYIGSLAGGGYLNLSTGRLGIGLNGQSTVFSGPITGSGSTNLWKYGPGTLNLVGASTLSGLALVSEGKLAVNANFNTMPVLVTGPGTLGGTGTVASVTVESGGTLAPGNSAGQLTVSGPLTMQAGSIYSVELNGVQAGTSYDQMAVAGQVTLGNATLQATLANPTAVSNSFTIVLNYSAFGVNGTFNGLPNNSLFYAGNRKFRVRYNAGNGNEVTLTQENTLPMLTTLNSPAAKGEGSPVQLTGNYNDPDNGDSVKMVVNWGDGSTTTNNVSGGTFAINHAYGDDNPTGTPQDFYSINAWPMDNQGIGFNEITPVLITNVPPTFNPPAGLGVLPGQPLMATLAISDPGSDTFQAYVNYGAGGGAPAVPVFGNLFNLNYSYPSNGNYTVTILVRDDDLGEKLLSFDVVVGLKLNITDAANNNVKLSWPGISQNLFVEGKTDVGGTNWTVVPIAPTFAGNEYYINVPKTNAASFYRLGWDPNAQ
jgi:autotransporter-associated beta strand protein